MADLKAAKSCGLKTIYVKRPREDRDVVSQDEKYVDMIVNDFVELAQNLGIT